MKYKKKDCPYFEENCPGGLNAGDEELTCSCPKFKAYVDAKDPVIIKQELEKMNIHAIEKMDIMLSMQKQFANRFHKVDELSKEEVDYWTNEYLVCIEDEIIEAEEFLDIYPEKIKEFNVTEYRKELIDVLHFIMDGMIVAGMQYSDIKKYYGQYLEKDISDKDLLVEMMDKEWLEVNKIEFNKRNLYILNYLLRDIRLVRQCISWKFWKKKNNEIEYEKMYKAYVNMLRHLAQAFIATGMTANEVYEVYVHKNIENVLRQQYGYLTGKSEK